MQGKDLGLRGWGHRDHASRTKLTLLHGANHNLLAYVDGSEACLHKLTTAMVGVFPQVPSINTTLYSQGSINILSKSTSCFLITATKYLTLSNLREGSWFWFIVQGYGSSWQGGRGGRHGKQLVTSHLLTGWKGKWMLARRWFSPFCCFIQLQVIHSSTCDGTIHIQGEASLTDIPRCVSL